MNEFDLLKKVRKGCGKEIPGPYSHILQGSYCGKPKVSFSRAYPESNRRKNCLCHECCAIEQFLYKNQSKSELNKKEFKEEKVK